MTLKLTAIPIALLLCLGCNKQEARDPISDLRPPELYSRQSQITDPGEDSVLFAELPVSPRAVLEQLGRSVLASYPAKGMARVQHRDVNVSTVGEMLEILSNRGNDFISEGPVTTKFVGLCYHWSLLATSVLRSRGYSCRVRCGFAPYLGRDRLGIDHTVIELWHPKEERWQLIDPELISIKPEESMSILHISEQIDPLSLPRDRFHLAATAWINYRSNRVPDGYYGLEGNQPSWGFVRTSLIRDWLNVLCDERNVSFDPRLMDLDELDESELLDSVAVLMLAPNANFESLKELSAIISRD